MFYIILATILVYLAKPLFNGLKLTFALFASMIGSKRFESSIDEYNKLHAADIDSRNASYA